MESEFDRVALENMLESGTLQECLQFFHGMSEKRRRECFTIIKPFWSQIRKNRFIEEKTGILRENSRAEIAEIAFFATASGAEIIKAKRFGYPVAEYAFAIIEDRRPNWVDQWIASLLEESYFWGHWHLIRKLIAAGHAQKPDSPRYFLSMISGLNSRRNDANLVDALQESADLLREDVWKLFEYDGDGENSLANTERFANSWIDAFLALMNQGRLPRAKLLDATVAALERDFNHYRAKWFVEFFDRLEPTDEELRKYGDRILGLLGASAPNVASWALGRVEFILTLVTFETATLCNAVEPLLRARAKRTVVAALKVLARQASVFPGDSTAVAMTVTSALSHESADVQKAAIQILASISSPQDARVRAVVEELLPTVAASVRGSVNDWLTSGAEDADTSQLLTTRRTGVSSHRQPKSADIWEDVPKVSKSMEALFSIDSLRESLKDGEFSIPAAVFDGTEIARLSMPRHLTPIETIEDLIDVCARVIEDGTLVDDAERCIDGLVRFCGNKPDDLGQRIAPLLKRVRQLLKKGCSPFCGVDPANDVMGLVYAFCMGIAIEPVLNGDTYEYVFEGDSLREYGINAKKPIEFLSAHCLAVARRIAAENPCQLLSTPTHLGGWINPCDLAQRVNKSSFLEPDLHDVVLALLRLAPDQRPAALKLIVEMPGEWVQAIRYALGEDNIAIGKTPALWAAAARARSPWDDDLRVLKEHPGLGPDTAQVANLKYHCTVRKSGPFTFFDPEIAVEPGVPSKVDPLLVTVLMYSSQILGKEYSFEMGGFGGSTIGAVRWTASIWPLGRESYFAASAHLCHANIDWSEAQWQNRTMLEPLLDSGTPLRYAGNLFLVGMLAAKEPGESGMATDIAIRAIEDGRLGSDNLGESLSLLLSCGIIKPGRWQKTLAEVARTSPVHAGVIQLALQRCFAGRTRDLPKDSAKLLELLYELSAELAIPLTNELCKTWLASGNLVGKGAKLAKNLLDLKYDDESRNSVRSILLQAINQRVIAAKNASQ